MTDKQIRKMLLLNLEGKQIEAFEKKEARRTRNRPPLCADNGVNREPEEVNERTPNR